MAKKSDLQKVGFNQTASASSTGIAPLHGSHAALPITCDASNARIMAVGEYHYSFIPQYRFAKAVECAAFLPFNAIRFHILTPFRTRWGQVYFSPFANPRRTRERFCQLGSKLFQKIFEKAKCACPKSPDRRISIVKSIQMI